MSQQAVRERTARPARPTRRPPVVVLAVLLVVLVVLPRGGRGGRVELGSGLRHQVTIDLIDRAPPEQSAIGPHYHAYVRLYVPAEARARAVRIAASAECDPVTRPAREPEGPPA